MEWVQSRIEKESVLRRNRGASQSKLLGDKFFTSTPFDTLKQRKCNSLSSFSTRLIAFFCWLIPLLQRGRLDRDTA